MRWQVVAGSDTIARGLVDDLDCPPHQTTQISIPLPAIRPEPGVEYFLDIRFDNAGTDEVAEPAFAEAVAWEQFRLPVYANRSSVDVRRAAKITPTTSDSLLVLRGEATDFELTFDLIAGTIRSYTFQGVELIRTGPEPNFWRPPTDNDFGNDMPRRLGIWRNASRDRMVTDVEHWQNSDRDVEIYVTTHLAAGDSEHRARYHVFGNGEVVMTNTFLPGTEDLPDLPKYGVSLTLPATFDQVQWLGRGPLENYWDRKTGANVGLHFSGVDRMHFPYIRPQETGNRADVRWVALSNSDGVGLLAVSDSLMNMSAMLFADEDFDEGDALTYRHTFDLVERAYVTLDLDYRQMGLGGDTSWGARPHPRYRLPPRRYEYRIRLLPFWPEDKPPVELALERF